MVAIPTGIISAGFVDQYSRLKKLSEYANEEDVHFIKVNLKKQDSWVGKQIMDLGLPHGMIVPKGELMLLEGDRVILYTQEKFSNASKIQI